MSLRRALPGLLACAALSSALSGCSTGPATTCAIGVDGAATAVKGLIDGARSAKAPADICRWISPTMTVSQHQLNELRSTYAHEPDRSLTITFVDQMGSGATVAVASADGTVHETYDAQADSHGRFTVAYGTPKPGITPTGPTSAPTPLPTP